MSLLVCSRCFLLWWKIWWDSQAVVPGTGVEASASCALRETKKHLDSSPRYSRFQWCLLSFFPKLTLVRHHILSANSRRGEHASLHTALFSNIIDVVLALTSQNEGKNALHSVGRGRVFSFLLQSVSQGEADSSFSSWKSYHGPFPTVGQFSFSELPK